MKLVCNTRLKVISLIKLILATIAFMAMGLATTGPVWLWLLLGW